MRYTHVANQVVLETVVEVKTEGESAAVAWAGTVGTASGDDGGGVFDADGDERFSEGSKLDSDKQFEWESEAESCDVGLTIAVDVSSVGGLG